MLMMDAPDLGNMIESTSTSLINLKKTQEELVGDTLRPHQDKISSSPEVFITDDNIVNTQESQPEVEAAIVNPDNPMGDAPVKNKVKNNVQPQVTRKSERLKKNITLTTTEKNELMAKKRNLEGNSSNQNMFSALSLSNIAELSEDMGVSVDKNDFHTFNILTELECARNDLYKKQHEGVMTNQKENIETANCIDGSPLPTQWIQEETSDVEDFTLVLSKKKAREQKKKLKLSLSSKKDKQTQEAPGLQTGRARRKNNNSKPPVEKRIKTRKK
jgi:hypothetical protein